MKTRLFTIALAVAGMVPVFGAQTPAKPAAPAAQAPAATAPAKTNTAATTKTKKHHKKAVKKSETAAKPAASTNVAKPASGAGK